MTRARIAGAVALALGAATLLGSCYRTHFELMPPTPSVKSQIYDNHFHFSVINIIEISAPVDLARACGGAPVASIYEDTGILGGIVNAIFSYAIPIFHVKNATVLCAYGQGPMGPPPMGQPPMGQPPMGPPGAQ